MATNSDAKESTSNNINSPKSPQSPSNPNAKRNGKYLQWGTLPHLEIKNFYMDDDNVDKHCAPLTWSNCDSTTFEVRRGPDYKPNSNQKAPSAKALYSVFGIDVYKSPQKISKISQFVDLTERINENNKKGHPYDYEKWPLPPVLIVNFMIPDYSPAMLGADKTDGKGFCLTLYAELADETREHLEKLYNGQITKSELLPSVRLLSKFVHASESRDSNNLFKDTLNNSANNNNNSNTNSNDSSNTNNNNSNTDSNTNSNDSSNNNSNSQTNSSSPKSSSKPKTTNKDGINTYGMSQEEIDEILQRFKIIVRVMNYTKTQMPYAMHPIVTRYNAKPFLARTSSTFYHEPGKYFAIDIDAHVFGKLARKSLGYMRECMETVIFDGAFVVEGKTNDELPEQVLCSARISKIGAKVAKEFPKDLLDEYLNRKKENTHTSHRHDCNSKSMMDLMEAKEKDNENDIASQTVPVINRDDVMASAQNGSDNNSGDNANTATMNGHASDKTDNNQDQG